MSANDQHLISESQDGALCECYDKDTQHFQKTILEWKRKNIQMDEAVFEGGT